MMSYKLSLIGAALLVANGTAWAESAPDVHAYPLVEITSGSCPTGFSLISKDMVLQINLLKNLVGKWQFVQLANGYVMAGAGYGYDIKQGTSSSMACYVSDLNPPVVVPEPPSPVEPDIIRFARNEGVDCPMGYGPIGVTRARANKDTILDTVLTGLWDWANVSTSHIMGGPGYGGDIKVGNPTATMICERNGAGLDLKHLKVEALEMLPNLSDSTLPTIFANGLMQYPIDVKVKLSIDGQPVELGDWHSALGDGGSPINMVRLYLGPRDYSTERPIEIPIDGEHVGTANKDWTASRIKNKYEQSLLGLSLTVAEREAGWNVYRYWVSAKAATPQSRPATICAIVGNSNNALDSCGSYRKQSVSINAKQPIKYNSNDFNIVVQTVHHDKSDDTKIDVITVQPNQFTLKDVNFSYIPTPKNLPEGMKQVGTYARHKGNALPAQYFHWNSQLYLVDRYDPIVFSPAITGLNVWKEKESTLDRPYINITQSGLTFVSTQSSVWKIITGEYTGWLLDPNRKTWQDTFGRYRWEWTTRPLILGQVEGRDQYGNPIRFGLGFDPSSLNYSISVK